MSLKEKLPRDLNIEESFRGDYKEIEKKLESKGDLDFTYRNVFVISAALAYKENMEPEKLENPKGMIPTRGMSTRQLWVLSSIAVDKEGITVLMDGKEIAKIMERYAKAGFPVLKKIMESATVMNGIKKLRKKMQHDTSKK